MKTNRKVLAALMMVLGVCASTVPGAWAAQYRCVVYKDGSFFGNVIIEAPTQAAAVEAAQAPYKGRNDVRIYGCYDVETTAKVLLILLELGK